MNRSLAAFVKFGLAIGLIMPVAWAQKPPAPPTPPVNPPPGAGGSPRPSTTLPSDSQPTDPPEDFVMFVFGQVATQDGSALPSNVLVERVCNSTLRQEVYASAAGDFSMQLGSMNDSTLDASAEGSAQAVEPNRFSDTGIPRRLLVGCELKVSASGFDSPTINLVDLDPSGKTLQVGTIRVRRRVPVAGTTLNAAAYKGVPQQAVVAYERGLDAEMRGKLASAQKHFERAVEIHAAYAHAWFQLGTVLQEERDKEGARAAYRRATALDGRYLAPHLALASLAYEEKNWTEVLSLTSPILELDPFKNMAGYTMELEPYNYAETYYFNAAASYALGRLDEAEKSALKAEQLFARSPKLHLLLGDIFARKKNYASAIDELKIYLELMPQARNAEQVRENLAELERQNNHPPSGAQTKPN